MSFIFFRSSSVVLFIFSVFTLIGCSDSPKRVSDEPLESIDGLDLSRYSGLWYEIARFPAFFQKGCVAVTAEYELREDGKVNVLNRCRKETLEGEVSEAKGVARVVDPDSNAKLKVKFDGFFSSFFEGDYWVIRLADDYSYAVVSEPKGRYLWILSRSPQMDEEIYAGIVESLKLDGFLVENLSQTLQFESANRE